MRVARFSLCKYSVFFEIKTILLIFFSSCFKNRELPFGGVCFTGDIALNWQS